jgi:hypothetical protein
LKYDKERPLQLSPTIYSVDEELRLKKGKFERRPSKVLIMSIVIIMSMRKMDIEVFLTFIVELFVSSKPGTMDSTSLISPSLGMQEGLLLTPCKPRRQC